MHGHTWTVEVEVSGQVNEEDGMLLDLAKLKVIINTIITPFDHHILNTWFAIPTCEKLAAFIKEQLTSFLAKGISVHRVKVQEGAGGWSIT
jgi:6-pyruvoyltetrahydropterin/6-carboxytetrahydropterin synthase